MEVFHAFLDRREFGKLYLRFIILACNLTWKSAWNNPWKSLEDIPEKLVIRTLLNITISYQKFQIHYLKYCQYLSFNPLSANPTKWSNTLKQFVGNCQWIVWVNLTILWGKRLKGSEISRRLKLWIFQIFKLLLWNYYLKTLF